MMQTDKLALILFCGLPGTGKSTLAYKLAQEKGWCLLSKDQINRSLEKENIESGRGGYEVLLDLTELNLKNSVPVILDASFGFERLRLRAQEIAKQYKAKFFGVECLCSDEDTIKNRIEVRTEMVMGWKPADLAEHNRVREYWEPWSNKHLKLDCVQSLEENYSELLKYLGHI